MRLATGWTVRGSNLVESKRFPFCTLAQTDPGADPASGTVVTEVFPGVIGGGLALIIPLPAL
jgi:hypothetical protein